MMLCVQDYRDGTIDSTSLYIIRYSYILFKEEFPVHKQYLRENGCHHITLCRGIPPHFRVSHTKIWCCQITSSQHQIYRAPHLRQRATGFDSFNFLFYTTTRRDDHRTHDLTSWRSICGMTRMANESPRAEQNIPSEDSHIASPIL
jgi:hypothetical protein